MDPTPTAHRPDIVSTSSRDRPFISAWWIESVSLESATHAEQADRIEPEVRRRAGRGKLELVLAGPSCDGGSRPRRHNPPSRAGGGAEPPNGGSPDLARSPCRSSGAKEPAAGQRGSGEP